MFKVGTNNQIVMTRGDTVEFNITIDSGTTLHPDIYILKGSDALYFGLSEYNCDFEHAILKRKFTKENLNEDGTITIRLESDDTVDLVPGVYFYEVKLEKVVYKKIISETTEVHTIVPRTKFTIL